MRASKYVIAIVVLQVLGVALMIHGAILWTNPELQSSGMVYEGKPVSEAEATAAFQDMAAMLSGARAGEPGSINMAYEPKTALGGRFKTFLVGQFELERKHDAEIAKYPLDAILAPKRFGTAAGRAKSLAELDKLEKAEESYIMQNIKDTEEMAEFVRSLRAKTDTSRTEKQVEESRQLLEASRKVFESYRRIVRHAGNSYVELNEKSEFVFLKDPDLEKFNALVEEASKAEEELNTLRTSILTERQKLMDSEMKVLMPRG